MKIFIRYFAVGYKKEKKQWVPVVYCKGIVEYCSKTAGLIHRQNPDLCQCDKVKIFYS